jgi:hypothetical protein
MATNLSFRLWATNMFCGQINFDVMKTSKILSIKEKIKIVKSLGNALIYNSVIKTNIKVFQVNHKIVQYLFQLILSPLLKCWDNNSVKRLVKKLKIK